MLKLVGVLAIVAMIAAHGHHHDHHDEPKSSVFAEILKHQHTDVSPWISQLKSIKLTRPLIYGFTTLAIITISLLPAMLLCFLPVRNSEGQFLKFLLAFGAGGLLGDAVLHIIPHAMMGHQHNHGEHVHEHHHHHHEEEEGHFHEHEHGAHSHGAHDHSHQLTIGVYVIIGILTFMIFEQFTRIFRGANDHHHCHHHHELQHLETRRTEHENEEEDDENTHKKEKTIKSSAYLNLVADFMHNITDGLIIGASFSINLYMGLLAMFTVLIHELPHEIGDFAILVQSGFTKFQAIRLQFLTALGALFGGYMAVWMTDDVEMLNSAANLWVMPFTAGGFIYIATVSVIPEILEVNLQNSIKKKILYSILNILFFVSGVFLMYLVAKFE